MPIYEFKCEKCQEEFEELCSADQKKVRCPHCGAEEANRLMSSPRVSSSSCSGGEGSFS